MDLLSSDEELWLWPTRQRHSISMAEIERSNLQRNGQNVREVQRSRRDSGRWRQLSVGGRLRLDQWRLHSIAPRLRCRVRWTLMDVADRDRNIEKTTDRLNEKRYSCVQFFLLVKEKRREKIGRYQRFDIFSSWIRRYWSDWCFADAEARRVSLSLSTRRFDVLNSKVIFNGFSAWLPEHFYRSFLSFSSSSFSAQRNVKAAAIIFRRWAQHCINTS